MQDLTYALRAMRRRPLTAALAVLTLALGIGGATTVFSVVEAVILRPLPFRTPDRLVRIWELTRDGDRFSFSEPDYLDVRARTRVLQSIAAYRDVSATAVLSGNGTPERIVAVPMTASLPDVLGVTASIGRMFTAAEGRPGSERPIVLSQGLWQRRFAAAPDIVGRLITLDGDPFQVTGVMPAGFDFPGGADAWVPLSPDPRHERDNKDLAVVGRLAPGATLAQLRSDLRDIARHIAQEHPRSNAGWSADAVLFLDWMVAPRFRDAVWVLFGAVSLLLLLACANVASLLVAKAAARRVEMRVRTALGAGRRRLIRQLLTESALLAALGTAFGTLLAFWAVDVVRALGSRQVPRLDGLRIDVAVLAFTCLAGAASCFVFGLVPALFASRVDLRSMDDGVRHSATGRRLQDGLVVLEVALALVLLVSAGLMGTSFVRLMHVNPGFQAGHAIAVPIELAPTRYSDARVAPFFDEVLARVRALPGVVAAGFTSTNPFRQFGFSNSVTPAERAAEAPPSGLVQAGWRSVTPGFFETMRIPVLSGRSFTPADRDGAERVVIVSASLARRLWPGERAVGKRIFWGGTTGPTRAVVGVVGDIRDVKLDAAPAPMLFVPHAQVPLSSMTLVVRGQAGPQGWLASLARVLPHEMCQRCQPPLIGSALASEVRDVLRSVDPTLPAPAVYDIATSLAEGVSGYRFNLWLLGAFALIALVLATTGVYAVLAHAVAERRREMAVRLALGASGTRITRLLVGNGLALSAGGVALGVAVAAAITRVLSSQLYDVAPTDPLTFAAAACGLLAVATMACYLPARRAAATDPMAALRRE
ncbi:MAG TPA: ABC transporter permease [Vicinamibacterales bacterium]|nr:ABC transporter permease [Vicinamibacterales bacterium]